MTQPTIARLSVHNSAIGHIIGRNGTTIQHIRNENDVIIYNSKYNDKTEYITFFIKGLSKNVESAKARIQERIDISNNWCKSNGYEYM